MTAFCLSITDELELRLFEEENAELFRALIEANRKELAKWFSWVEESRSSKWPLEFIRRAQKHFEEGSAIELVIWYRGEPVGSVDLDQIDPKKSRSAHVGYWLHKSLWGRGLVTKSCRRLIDHAFFKMGLNRIEIRCATDNIRSQRIPERLGFVQEGLLRQALWICNRTQDLIVYSMLARDWARE